MPHTRTELDALTAKALRPIAADLGITGVSRMRKDEIISSIIAAEDTATAKSEGDIADFNEEAVYAAVRVVPSPQDLPEIPEPAPGAVSIELTDGFPSVEEIKREAALMAAIDVDEPLRAVLTPPPAEEYFARKTRRGVETVVVEREHGGRVDYRIIDPRTGRRSSIYRLRAVKFAQEYVKVPS